MGQKFLYNNKKLRHRRKDLRNNQTETELIIWEYLKNSKLNGYKFVRQYSVGPYILDFYCPKVRLAIELDGQSHNGVENIIYDKERTKYLESVDIKVIKFWNSEVVGDIKRVLEKIRENLTPPNPLLP